MFKKILIANRGEIAVRVMRTAKEMGIATAAIFSDADQKALHVLEADEAIHIGPSEPHESYLAIEKIIDAAKRTNAQAIHPGYGFLSENARFAQAVEDSGLVFIGPPSKVIAALGDKTCARQMMQKSGVPVIPGTTTASLNVNALAEQAGEVGFPLLIKAAAGGGGKGMRIVEKPQDFADACKSAISEAAAAFGNGAVYLEKRLARPRHIEIQILADSHGNFIHLNERECSIQRRHQKIIEETPSPALTPDLRERMGAAAIAAAKAAGYVNAGTVEFLLDADNSFLFLEVNTRLQVEHPITELVTGEDLVRCQIEIAAGKRLSLKQEDIRPRGHAIECRIYGEDPQNGFLPSPGKILHFAPPQGPGIRHDCGIYEGFTVPTDYDPILAKLCVLATDRPQAIARMKNALADYALLGIRTNTAFMHAVLSSPEFERGETYTDFLPELFGSWSPSPQNDAFFALAGVLAQLADFQSPAASTSAGKKRPPTPFETLGPWRL
ncbi:MAG: acetyl-CoA carboxylase biotin carboxylase subunit [Desulfatibacillaceae bacterium]|nr:acetyl-CoA carboxylase biotin carboxylase subunit [Desulfatibacillaceae bacterium]